MGQRARRSFRELAAVALGQHRRGLRVAHVGEPGFHQQLLARGEIAHDDATARLVELPLELPAGELLKRLAEPMAGAAAPKHAPAPRGPGRPKLGVVAREVTLLPRHWAYLRDQPGGASVALRRLVEEARRKSEAADTIRRAQDVCYRFMAAMAGDEPGFEEAARALFAGDRARFEERVAGWPEDVRAHALRLSRAALARQGASQRPL